MKYYIYCITNKLNRKSYVGQSTNTKERWKDHIWDAMRHGNYRRYAFQNAIRKYGADNFLWQVIEEHETQEQVNSAEEFFIEYLNTLAPNGYNLSMGGKNYGISKNTRKKISDTLKKTSYFIGKKGKDHPNFGRRWPEEYKKARSENYKDDNSTGKKINSTTAIDIYMDGLTTNMSLRQLSEKYPIKKGAISNILHRRTWSNSTAHLPDINFDTNDFNGRGSSNNTNSTPIETVKQIIKDFQSSNIKKSIFAKLNHNKYGVKPSTICDILSGRSFKRYLT